MGRSAYAYRDLDEELQASFPDGDYVHVYHSQQSPPSCGVRAALSLSESSMLKTYLDHQRAQRRRKLLGVGLFVLVALVGVVPMLLTAQAEDEASALELALAAPYKSLRPRGETRRGISNPVSDEDLRSDRPDKPEPNVGDVDPHDDKLIASVEIAAAIDDAGLGDSVDEQTEDAPLGDDEENDGHIAPAQHLRRAPDADVDVDDDRDEFNA